MAQFVQVQPKNALRKARDFQKVGRIQDACDALHSAITSRRMGRVWTPEHEELMLEFISLCVDLRDPRLAKDGLYHYRQLTQVQAPASLEKVIQHLVDTSGRKAADARARANIDPGGELTAVEDLEDENQAPEALLMGAVTSEGSRERVEREVLVPWVRHMWDTFRNVLETLRNVTKLEKLYHGVAVRAMGFCKAYSRAPEFKKLCKTLRDHFVGMRRAHEANNTVMTPESLELHLTTRFTQLETCAELALWNEGFRTIEDIFGGCGGCGALHRTLCTFCVALNEVRKQEWR